MVMQPWVATSPTWKASKSPHTQATPQTNYIRISWHEVRYQWTSAFLEDSSLKGWLRQEHGGQGADLVSAGTWEKKGFSFVDSGKLFIEF